MCSVYMPLNRYVYEKIDGAFYLLQSEAYLWKFIKGKAYREIENSSLSAIPEGTWS